MKLDKCYKYRHRWVACESNIYIPYDTIIWRREEQLRKQL